MMENEKLDNNQENLVPKKMSPAKKAGLIALVFSLIAAPNIACIGIDAVNNQQKPAVTAPAMNEEQKDMAKQLLENVSTGEKPTNGINRLTSQPSPTPNV